MPNARGKNRRDSEAGYTLLMVVFLVATMLIFALAGTQSLLTQGQRELEKETVWRGEQYQRAIGLYYVKFGRYPTKIEDLTRQTNGVRFLRKAYTDPMNKTDGTWRFIYVGPNGQLIGSLRQTSLLQSVVSSASFGGGTGFGNGLQPLSTPSATPGQSTGAPGQAPGANVGGQQTNNAAAPNPLESQPQALDGPLIGGNIIGVGSKNKKPSFRVYLGGDTYQKWEFIWNPVQQSLVPAQTPVNPNANSTGAPNAQAPDPSAQTPGANPPPPTPPAQ